MLIMQGDSEDQSSVNLSITIRSAPSKGWFQRFWWILPTALFLSFVFDQIFEKIEKAGDQPLVSPNKKMRVEVSEISKSEKGPTQTSTKTSSR